MRSKIASRIFLCGFMGTGKSTIGRALAEMTGYSFIDLDEAIEKEVGRSVREIFEREGESFFRKKERQNVINFLDKTELVLALGGGSLQNSSVTGRVKNNSLLVFIECPFSVILRRIKGDEKRPLLLNSEGSQKEFEALKNELKKRYENRLPLYNQAHIIIDSSAFTNPEEAASYLYQRIEEYGTSN